MATRCSADADKPAIRNARHIIWSVRLRYISFAVPSSYGSISLFLTYLILKIPRPWNLDQRSLKVIETGTIQQITYGFY